MIRISIKHLHIAAQNRPNGYVDEVIASGEIKGDVLFLEESTYRKLCERYDGPHSIISPPTPKPRQVQPEQWPTLLLPMKLLAKEGDRGAGDIIARVIGPIGGDAFKLWYKATFGRDCGCGNRQDALNRRWPL